MSGLLSIVATPIGNLEDLSERARRLLMEADLVACEDTRHTGLLLARLEGERPPLLSVHEHNEARRLPRLLDALDQGQHVVLVSDAGTPLLSDPGYQLVRAATAAGHRVEAAPGPSALLAALVVSGLPPLPFTFAGFPPQKGGKRRRFFERWRDLGHTLVVYESPFRIVACLADAGAALGDRPAVVARELTKRHEEIRRGTLDSLRQELGERDRIKGELVLVIGPSGVEPQASS